MTKEELKKMMARLLVWEKELEDYIKEYKADGKITKEERFNLKKLDKKLGWQKRKLNRLPTF